ncbi:MAG TPA: O-antigen ligase family protein, partial [Polyangia bacterium]|nr:O-antigen ligase family protein [Polyangia bacterium]
MRPLDGARVHIVGVVLTGLAATAAIGGVHPPVQVALSASALLWFAILVWRRGARGLRVLPFVAPAALALGFTLVQLVPLPRALVGLISPAALELREGALGHAPAWLPLTVDVPATLLELVKGFACLGLLITTAHLCRRRSNARVVLWPLAFLGVALGALVMAQRLTGASTILGYHVRATLGVGFFGTLVCGNHAASIFALSALCAVGLAVEKEGAARFVLAWAAASSAAGLFYTTSRGGACGFAIGGALLVAIVVGRRVGRLQGVLAAAILLMVATGGALWLADGLRSRLVPSSTHEIWSNPKTRGMRDGLVLARHFPWTGVGRGAFEAPVAAYRAVEDGVRLVYPENLPVELAAEYGLPIAAALLVLAVMSARRVRQRLSKL